MSRGYLSPAQTAKLLRQALKESFPGAKFGVITRKYAGGASIDVTWTDGPNHYQVNQLAQEFAGSYFDGGIDYKGSRYHTLDGEPVSFGANFIFCSRESSDAAVERAIATVRNEYGADCGATVVTFRKGQLWNVTPLGNAQGDMHWSMDQLIKRALSKRTDRLLVTESATLKRVAFAGDDGYGAGTVGTGDGTAKGYPRTNSARDELRDQLKNAKPVGGVQ